MGIQYYIMISTTTYSLFIALIIECILLYRVCILPIGPGTDQGDELDRQTIAHPQGAGHQGHIGLYAVAQQPDGQPEQPIVRAAGDQAGWHG